MNPTFETTNVLGCEYAELDYSSATDVIIGWARERSHRIVSVTPVSSLMMARRNGDLKAAFSRSDMITSDGMPIVWSRWLLGRRDATRLYGPDLMLHVIKACAEQGVPIALLGGLPERLGGLESKLHEIAPGLEISYSWSPPFRSLSDDEVMTIAEDIRFSGAEVIFVGLGCPKQECLMHRLSTDLPGVQIGVGAAFDFIPGYVRQAPKWVQRFGLEWAFRIACEPRRLWKRYAMTIPPFLGLIALQILAAFAASLANPNSRRQSV